MRNNYLNQFLSKIQQYMSCIREWLRHIVEHVLTRTFYQCLSSTWLHKEYSHLHECETPLTSINLTPPISPKGAGSFSRFHPESLRAVYRPIQLSPMDNGKWRVQNFVCRLCYLNLFDVNDIIFLD